MRRRLGNEPCYLHDRRARRGVGVQSRRRLSETFRTRQAAQAAAERAAQEQRAPGESVPIEFEDSAGRWHEEDESGDDRPDAQVKD
jgi:hypothetical protein